MTLRLRNYGFATAYATVGVGDVVPEMNVARKAMKAYEEANSERPESERELWPPEIIFLLGQADVATIYKTKNFKRIFELRYPRSDSQASVVNWVFSVPFEGGREADESEASPFRFMIHLRLRRAVYAYPGIEKKIVKKLTDLLGTHAAGARIHAGLGWSDLIVEGYFEPGESFHDLIRFIIQTHSLRIVYGPERKTLPVLQRILTVFGYREKNGEAPDFEAKRVVTFLRGAPGGYAELLKELGKSDRIDILDGKADFMVTSEPPPARWLERQRKLGGNRKFRKFLRKVETHLMFFPAEDFHKYTSGADLDIDVGEATLHDEENCGCERKVLSAAAAIEAEMSRLRRDGDAKQPLPIEHRYAIDNALFLLAATLRDSSICCDARDAVLACCGGLLRILRDIGAPSDASPASRYRQMWKRLDEWHRLSELLLRQRTVGSYEEILGQSDRSIVYSGGVQKFLYLADQLMKDFARRVQPIEPPDFAAIYDSVKIIFSFYRSGPLVRVPTSRIFGFPLIVPDLWHEVAAALFFLRHGDQFGAIVRDDPHRHDFMANIADHYADVIVYLYGFRGDFEKFIVSLVHGWSLAYRDVPPDVWQLCVGNFLLRAYLVYEFDCIRAARKSRDAERMLALADADSAAMLIAELKEQLQPAELQRISHADWMRLHANIVRTDFSKFHRQLYWPMVDVEFPAQAVDLSRFDEGEIVELNGDTDINALFGELSYRLTKKAHLTDTDFAAAAALGESAANEYRRRQMRTKPAGEADGRR